MAQPFTLRFVLADGQADSLDLSQVWEDEASARELEDDVIGLFAGEVLLARLVVLPADESRGKAVLHAIAQVASRHGDAEAVETVGFVIENATAIVVAQPVLTEEDDRDPREAEQERRMNKTITRKCKRLVHDQKMQP